MLCPSPPVYNPRPDDDATPNNPAGAPYDRQPVSGGPRAHCHSGWHFLTALLAGLLVYALVGLDRARLAAAPSGTRAHWLIVALIVVAVVGLITALIIGIIAFLNSEHGNPTVLFQRVGPLLDRARAQLLPRWFSFCPQAWTTFAPSPWNGLRDHAAQLQGAGKQAVRILVQLIIGIVIGAMVALHKARDLPPGGPLTVTLSTRAANVVTAFKDVVFAQVKISAVNTLLTGIFLLVVLPIFGVYLPPAKTLVVATFVVGLLPVVGNLISNTLIFVMGLSISLWVAVAALGYLIVIHKLEYLLNARIIGTQIRARAWSCSSRCC